MPEPIPPARRSLFITLGVGAAVLLAALVVPRLMPAPPSVAPVQSRPVPPLLHALTPDASVGTGRVSEVLWDDDAGTLRLELQTTRPESLRIDFHRLEGSIAEPIVRTATLGLYRVGPADAATDERDEALMQAVAGVLLEAEDAGIEAPHLKALGEP